MSFSSHTPAPKSTGGGKRDFLTFMIDGQLLGIPVLQVQDVLARQKVTRVPLAPPEVEGSLNLRGRIVTAINLRRRLDIQGEQPAKTMSIVVEYKGDLYSLTVDGVGDVIGLPVMSAETPPATLEPVWRRHAVEIYRLEDKLLVILDINGMLDDLSAADDEDVEEEDAA